MATLYKYKSLENFEWIKEIIRDKKLYAATYKQLQDGDEKEGVYNVVGNDVPREILDRIKYEKIGIRICSLSGRADNKHLWEKYADNHKGIVIEVEIKDVIKIAGMSPIRLVKYGELYKLEEPVPPNEELPVAMDILTHKKAKWAAEEEVRVFVPISENEANKNHYLKVKIKRIIAGRNIGKENFNLIKNMVRRYNRNIAVTKEPKQIIRRLCQAIGIKN